MPRNMRPPITMAIKNKLDISIQIATGSATQMAIFVAPVLVLISIFFAQPMNLVFNIFELSEHDPRGGHRESCGAGRRNKLA